MPKASTLEYSKAFRVLFNNYVKRGRRGKQWREEGRREEKQEKVKVRLSLLSIHVT